MQYSQEACSDECVAVFSRYYKRHVGDMQEFSVQQEGQNGPGKSSAHFQSQGKSLAPDQALCK